MSGPTPDKWGTNSPVDAVCCSRGSGYKDSENACNIGLGKGYAGKTGMAKPKTCPTGSTKCGSDACIKIAAGKYCLRDDGGDSSKDKLIDNTCAAWYEMSKESKACGAITWTDATAPTGSCSKSDDDCKYTNYKTGAFTDAAKSTNKDAKLECYGVTYGKKDEDKKLTVGFGESKSAPEGGDALQCLAHGLYSDADTSWKGCIAYVFGLLLFVSILSISHLFPSCSFFLPSSFFFLCFSNNNSPDTTKQGCPGLQYGESAKKQFYPDDACPCNSYDATTGASSATSAALSASAIIGSVGLLALL